MEKYNFFNNEYFEDNKDTIKKNTNKILFMYLYFFNNNKQFSKRC